MIIKTLEHQQALQILSKTIAIFPYINTILYKMAQLLELSAQLSAIDKNLAQNSDALKKQLYLLQQLPKLINDRDIILLQQETIRLIILLGGHKNHQFSIDSSNIIHEYKAHLYAGKRLIDIDNFKFLGDIINDYIADMMCVQEDFKGSEYVIKKDYQRMLQDNHYLDLTMKDKEAKNLLHLASRKKLLLKNDIFSKI